MTILVTGASGNLGSTLVAKLAQQYDVIAAVRNPEQVQQVSKVNYRTFDYNDTATYSSALEGVDSVVLQAPPLDGQAYERLLPFINKLADTGIKRVVFISAYGVDHNDQAPLRKIELALIEQGFNYTIVRPNFFMENFTSGFAAPALEHDNSVIASAGDGKLAFVSIKDIADVVATVIADSQYNTTEFTLTGPEAFSHGEVAQLIAKARNTEVKYIAITGEELKAGAVANGLPEPCADYLVKLYDIAAAGLMASTTTDVETILQRAPTQLNQVVA